MGYISEIVLVTSKDAYSRLMAAVAKYPEGTRLVVEGIKDENYGRGGDLADDILFHWDWIKWYKDSKAIDAIESWMDEEDLIVEDYDDVEYQFVRIGESLDDNEERGNCTYGLCISRKIDF